MDALHFRQRAEQARELARNGEDMRLTQLLLALADDMDAEAEAIDDESIMATLPLGQPRTAR